MFSLGFIVTQAAILEKLCLETMDLDPDENADDLGAEKSSDRYLPKPSGVKC